MNSTGSCLCALDLIMSVPVSLISASNGPHRYLARALSALFYFFLSAVSNCCFITLGQMSAASKRVGYLEQTL